VKSNVSVCIFSKSHATSSLQVFLLLALGVMISRSHLSTPGSNTEVCRPLFPQPSHLAAALVRIPTSTNLTIFVFSPSYAVFWSSLSSMASSDRLFDEKSRHSQAITTYPTLSSVHPLNTHSFWFHLLVPPFLLSHCCASAFWIAVTRLFTLAPIDQL